MNAEPLFPNLRIGSRLGAYRLIELIGRGGMGEVYQAERADDVYHSRVAIKLVRVDHDPQQVAHELRGTELGQHFSPTSSLRRRIRLRPRRLKLRETSC